MGMDVYGASGNYFRRSIWGWRPLADYIVDEHTSYAQFCNYWHSNDGDGLDADQSIWLADAMQEALEDGSALEYIVQRNADLARLPEETCAQCKGTGIRTDEVGIKFGWPDKIAERGPRAGQKGSCNGCGGAGTTPAWDTNYSLDVDDIVEFIDFLRKSEGFEIC